MRNMLIAAISLAMLVGCHPKQKSENLTTEKAIVVTTSKVIQEKASVELRYSGSVEAGQTIPLSFATTGTVESVLVEAGDAVQKGQLLATIQKNDLQSMYEITQAKYEQAKDAYNRLKEVHDKGSLPEIKWVEMEANLNQAKSSLDLSTNNLGKCNLYAPVTGFIGNRNIEPGMSSIVIGSAPLELVDIKQVYIKISVPENEVAKITKGMKATCMVSALNDQSFTGEVSNISPVADLISRTYEAKIKVANPAFELKPGMVCDVKIDENSDKEMVLVPYQSVSKDENDQAYVFLVNPDAQRVKKQPIKTGRYCGSNLEVISGLAQGQIVVKEGKEKLSDNHLITF